MSFIQGHYIRILSLRSTITFTAGSVGGGMGGFGWVNVLLQFLMNLECGVLAKHWLGKDSGEV